MFDVARIVADIIFLRLVIGELDPLLPLEGSTQTYTRRKRFLVNPPFG